MRRARCVLVVLLVACSSPIGQSGLPDDLALSALTGDQQVQLCNWMGEVLPYRCGLCDSPSAALKSVYGGDEACQTELYMVLDGCSATVHNFEDCTLDDASCATSRDCGWLTSCFSDISFLGGSTCSGI